MKWIYSLLCSSLICGLLVTTAHAETIEELTNSLNKINQQVSDAQSQKETLKVETDQLEKALQSINDQIKTNKSTIETIKQDILQQNQNIGKNQSALDQTEHDYGQQAKVMYEEGDITFLDVLLQANSFNDFLTRLKAFEMIAQSNENKIKKIHVLQETILKEKEDNLQKLNTVQQKQQDLNTLMETKKVVQQQKREQIDELDKTISAKNTEAESIQEQINFEKEEALLAKQHPIQDGTGDKEFVTGITYSGSAGTIISTASQYMGTPYSWGGTSPSGFDCSGFTQYIFGRAGVPLGRTAATQFNQGISISRSNLKPGDLVFFSTYGPGATHVGIYIGYDMMINAEDRGVRVSDIGNSYWASRYIGARRILS